MIKLLKSFKYAFCGILHGFYERNFRIHITAVCFVSAYAAKFGNLSKTEWALLFLTFAGVISAELFNTAIERLCDKISPERDEKIKLCKDCAAGAVLVCALFAVGAAIALFGDLEELSAAVAYFAENPLRLVFLAASVIIAAVFVFLPERFKKR